MLSKIGTGLRSAVHLIARPVKADHGHGGAVIQPYRGYGSREEAFLMGRIFRQPGGGSDEATLTRDLVDVGRRILRHGIGEAVLVARFAGTEQRVTTDRDGYFHIQMRLDRPPPADRFWHRMELELVEPADAAAAAAKAEGELFVPPDDARFVVISDIDDTVMYTGVANKAMMMWRLFVQGAESRIAFPGVAAFYRALHRGTADGPPGAELNPMLYVSRGPWSIYEVLDAFFNMHGIPVGPILFLREWGLTLQRPLPQRSEDHKLNLIRDMLALYGDLPFVLIGDSGQHDPELYAQVVREHPGRVLAIYIRNITQDEERKRAIETLAEEVAAAGSSLLLAADSFAMAEHAADHGLIAPAALAEVLVERQARPEGEPDLQPTRTVERQTAGETREAVAHGAVKEALEAETPDETPPNVAVEPEAEKPEDRARRRS